MSRMKIGLLRLGLVDAEILERIRIRLEGILSWATFEAMSAVLPLPRGAFNIQRAQYRSDMLLAKVKEYGEKAGNLDRVLGVTGVDIFVPGYNFVFGEAECPGQAAVISLYRLSPEFYGEAPDFERLIERSLKEAVHELGHTLGLDHCRNPLCVMHFSNSILDTDRKKAVFCSPCQLRVKRFLEALQSHGEEV